MRANGEENANESVMSKVLKICPLSLIPGVGL